MDICMHLLIDKGQGWWKKGRSSDCMTCLKKKIEEIEREYGVYFRKDITSMVCNLSCSKQ